MAIFGDDASTDLAATVRSQRSYASLVWAVRFAMLAAAVAAIIIIAGVDTLVMIGLACPMLSLLLLLATMVAVVASQARAHLPNDSLPAQLQLPISIIGHAARDAISGVPRLHHS